MVVLFIVSHRVRGLIMMMVMRHSMIDTQLRYQISKTPLARHDSAVDIAPMDDSGAPANVEVLWSPPICPNRILLINSS